MDRPTKKKNHGAKNGRGPNLANSVDNFTDVFKDFKDSFAPSGSSAPSSETQMLMLLATPTRRKQAVTILQNDCGMFIMSSSSAKFILMFV